ALTEANLYIHLVSGSGIDRQTISEAMVRVARPLRTRIKALCDGTKNEADHDPPRANVAVGDLLAKANPLIRVMKCLLNDETTVNNQLLVDACDEVAKSIHTALVSFANETQKWEVCERYLEEALSITANQDLREQISEALGIVRQNAEIDREIAKRQ